MCDFSARLVPWLDRELSEREAAEVERHLDGCPECRTQAESYARMSRAFDTYCDGVMSQAKPVASRHRVRIVSGAAAVAATAIALFLAVPRAPVQKLPGLHNPVAAVAAPSSVAEVSSAPAKKIHRHPPAQAVQSQPAAWTPTEPTLEIAIPADAMYPPGAVPDGMSLIVDVRLTADGSAPQLRLRP